jgi:hypothetical protein
MLVMGWVVGCPIGGSHLAAQGAPKPELPKAEDILDKEAEAMGGKAANQKVKTVVVKGKISQGDSQVGFIIYHAGPNKQSMEYIDEGVSRWEFVVSGELAWHKHSITGSRLLDGEEKAAFFRNANEVDNGFQQVGDWRKKYEQVKCVAEEKVDGKPAYKVQLIGQDGKVVIAHYDKETGFQVRRKAANTVTCFGDFRKVGDIVQAFTVRIGEGPARMVITADQIELNVDIPEVHFALPAELQKQLKQR